MKKTLKVLNENCLKISRFLAIERKQVQITERGMHFCNFIRVDFSDDHFRVSVTPSIQIIEKSKSGCEYAQL